MLLPSCVKSQMGECIRAPQKEHRYLNLQDATAAYRTANGQTVYLLDESIQVRQEKWIYCDDDLCHFTYPNSKAISQVKTGKSTWAESGRTKPCRILKPLEEEPNLAGATASALPQSKYAYEYIRQLPEQEQKQAAWWRVALAAPFDYAIDPVITVTGSTAYSIGLGGAVIWQFLSHSVAQLFNSSQI